MKAIIEIILTILFLSVGLNVTYEAIYKPLKRAAIIKLHEGIPPLSPFTEKMTGFEEED